MLNLNYFLPLRQLLITTTTTSTQAVCMLTYSLKTVSAILLKRRAHRQPAESGSQATAKSALLQKTRRSENTVSALICILRLSQPLSTVQDKNRYRKCAGLASYNYSEPAVLLHSRQLKPHAVYSTRWLQLRRLLYINRRRVFETQSMPFNIRWLWWEPVT